MTSSNQNLSGETKAPTVVGISDLFGYASYCPICNYGVDKLCIEQARYDYMCPNCNRQHISMFYSIGSQTHKRQLMDADYDAKTPRNYLTVNPPPWPN